MAFASHALAAALFAALIVWRLVVGVRGNDQRLLLGAFVLTATWAWLSAIAGPTAPITILCETARNLVWVGLLHALAVSMEGGDRQHGVRLVYGAEALVIGLQMSLNVLVLTTPLSSDALTAIAATRVLLRMTMASGALVLVHNLYAQAAPDSRSAIRFAMLALAITWSYDLNLYTIAWLDPRLADHLFDWRGIAVALTAPLFALSARGGAQWRVRLSRAATFQSLSLLAICGYFIVMTILATAMRGTGWDWLRGLAVALLAVLIVATMVILPSPRARGWAKVKLAKHFFEHRYDYRAEWLRFTDTLGRAGPDAPPLGERTIQAFADILDAPGGLLLVPEDGGMTSIVADWGWPGAMPSPAAGADDGFWQALQSEGRIVEFDSYRGGWGNPRDMALAIPDWLLREQAAWTGVPLTHHDRVVGLVLLAAPEYRRGLDWEDYDLLRTAGRQAASSLAEAHGQEALSNAQRFEEFNRRFAFILHDVKNLVSQLSLLSRNAERHADNAEFRADMIATLKSSVGKMNDLLARLAPKAASRSAQAVPTPLRDLLAQAIAARRRDRDIRLSGDCGQWALADPIGLEQAVSNLLQNALDASAADQPVTVRLRRDSGEVAIAIIDKGAGMDSDFIRNRLFQPFASTKDNGFGVGAFEARSLVAAMGGRLTVTSRPGDGSNFTIHLPVAEPAGEPLRKIA